MSAIDTLWHRWLRVPYTLHTRVYRQPKRYKQTIVLLHGIGNSHKAWSELAPKLPEDTRIIAVDLLGFGDSPRPSWVKYNLTSQARSVFKTLLTLGVRGRVTLVGHSLGSLVSIKIARRYPLFVKRLVLCSPPLYKPEETGKWLMKRDDRLRQIYKAVRKNPAQLLPLVPAAKQLGLLNKAFSVDTDSLETYTATLEASIINQDAYDDVLVLKQPIHLMYGRLDPVLVTKNLKELAAHNTQISVEPVLAGHEVMGVFSDKLAAYLNSTDTSR